MPTTAAAGSHRQCKENRPGLDLGAAKEAVVEKGNGGSIMACTIQIKAGAVSLQAELNGSATAQAIAAALPIRGKANRWGDEIYFRISVRVELASDARSQMAIGELAYWPPGQAFCIFFGRTPASSDAHPKAASPANPVGRVLGEATAFAAVVNGADVLLAKA